MVVASTATRFGWRRRKEPAPFDRVDPVDRVDHVAWLADGFLLLAGSVQSDGEGEPRLMLLGPGATPAVEARAMFLPAAAGPGARVRTAILAVIVDPHLDLEGLSVVHHEGASERVLAPSPVSPALTELRTLIREDLAPLDPDARAKVIEFVGSAVSASEELQTSDVVDGLRQLREALRQRHAITVGDWESPRAICLDALLRIDDDSYYAIGWLHASAAPVSRLTLDSPEGMRVELRDTAWFHDRPDVTKAFAPDRDKRELATRGFVCRFDLPGPSRAVDGWMLEMSDAGGATVEVAAPQVITDPLIVRHGILNTLNREKLPEAELRRLHIHPAIERIQARASGEAEVVKVNQYGQPPQSPAVSVIVPLYGRIDLVEHQIAQFALDPEFSDVDLLYVLDSPELAGALAGSVSELHELYELPFRTVELKGNLGFSGANNVGATLAAGRWLLLLNSDVFPDRPGWLGTMVSFFNQTAGIGALGPKLLYEDDTLQHAGLYFARRPGDHLWNNEHYFKGFDRRLAAANVARPVPALTAACMLIESTVYRDLGGMHGSYIRGDYEDSDLCLRLNELGLASWYLPDAELYHLEAQSYGWDERSSNDEYNRWLHTHRWNDRIKRVMAAFASAV